jgi:hypothetical protein
MRTVIIINGYPNAGKDTFVQMFTDFNVDTDNFHTSTPAKEALKHMGWDGDFNGDKPKDIRDALAGMMRMSYELFDGPTKWIKGQVMNGVAKYSFVHCREPYNIANIKEQLEKAGFKVLTLCIRKKQDDKVYTNYSDNVVMDYEYDEYVSNDGDLEALKWKAGMLYDLLERGLV